MLRGGHKEIHQQETDRTTPPLGDFRMEVDRLKAATPVSRPEERVETPDMSQQRPRTAGGPGDRGKQFHKKVAPAAPISTDTQAFAFPFPSPSNKSASFLYTAEIHEEREGIIGVALGSPTMATHSTNFVTSQHGTVTYISSNNASHNYLPEPTDVKQDSPKPKLSRWKSIFKKTPAPQQQQGPFYQLAPAASPARMDSHHDDESLDSRTMSPLDRVPSPPTFKPEIRESRKLPKGHPQPPIETRPHALTIGVGKPKSSFLRSASSPKPPPKDFSPTVPQVVVSGSQSSSPRTIGERSLLDVDIPSIQMERYSVMFSSFLQPNSNSSSNRSSSLLVRRQGNSERLKPLNELSTKNEDDGTRNGMMKPQRRATSPSFPKSPSVGLSLFPQPTDGNHRRTPSPRAVSVHRPRPLQRSKTAPSSSPSRQNFSIPRPSNDVPRKVSQDEERGQNENLDPGLKTQLLTPTPSTGRSFESESEEITIVVARAGPGQTWKPSIEENEPQWEIVSKPALTNTPQNPVSQDGPSSAPLAESKTQMASPTAAPRSADLAISQKSQTESKATLGVARSVSVSRANRPEFLKPTLMKRATEGSERLVDKRALTPTLVELKNRKSQRVQLVEA